MIKNKDSESIQFLDGSSELAAIKELLEISEAKLAAVLESAPAGVLVVNQHGKIDYMNRAGQQVWGGFPNAHNPGQYDEYRGFWPDSGKALDASEWACSQAFLTGKSIEPRRVRILTLDNKEKFITAAANPILNKNGDVVGAIGINQDVTDLVKAGHALQESKDFHTITRAHNVELGAARVEADLANDQKSAFLANMSHEIRSPLGAIMGFSELLRHSDLTKIDRENYLEVIQRNSEQLLRVIDDILDLAKVEAGKMTIEHIEFSLTELLADFASIIGFKARENGIRFELTAETALPEKIVSDPVRVRQILNNAVGNAVKFTTAGYVKLKVSYKESVLYFEISDTGRGISEEQAKALFKPFTQADASTTRKFGGTGLGLVLTRHLCATLGGDFKLLGSALEHGSTFLATLKAPAIPNVRVVPANEIQFRATPGRKALDEQKRFAGLRILLVEDSPDNQVLIKVMVQKLGGEIIISSNGKEGVERALTESIDVVLMDIQMPEMDGHEAVRTLRAKGFKTPIIALTAHAMKEEIARARESGFSSFVTKPIDRESLIEAVLSQTRRQ